MLFLFISSLYLSIPLFAITTMGSSLCGLAAFGYYASKGCDPIASKKIQDPNQVCS